MNKLSLIILTFALISCKKAKERACFKNAGNPIVLDKIVIPFDSVDVSGNVNLILSYDTAYSLRIETKENLMNFISTEILGSKLIIKNLNKCNFLRQYEPIVIYIKFPSLQHMVLSDNSNVKSEGKIYAKDFSLFNYSTGDAEIEIDSESLYTLSTGVGDLRIKGRAGHHQIFVRKHSFVFCEELDTWDTSIYTSSSGKITVKAENNLDVFLDGKGNVYYIGNPNNIQLNRKGEGELIKK
jgi:hypothetical protein